MSRRMDERRAETASPMGTRRRFGSRAVDGRTAKILTEPRTGPRAWPAAAWLAAVGLQALLELSGNARYAAPFLPVIQLIVLLVGLQVLAAWRAPRSAN